MRHTPKTPTMRSVHVLSLCISFLYSTNLVLSTPFLVLNNNNITKHTSTIKIQSPTVSTKPSDVFTSTPNLVPTLKNILSEILGTQPKLNNTTNWNNTLEWIKFRDKFVTPDDLEVTSDDLEVTYR